MSAICFFEDGILGWLIACCRMNFIFTFWNKPSMVFALDVYSNALLAPGKKASDAHLLPYLYLSESLHFSHRLGS